MLVEDIKIVQQDTLQLLVDEDVVGHLQTLQPLVEGSLIVHQDYLQLLVEEELIAL
jgi:hypothetical protein